MSSIHAKWWATVTVLLSLVVRTYTQTIAPSNGTQDLYPSATSPRFILNGTQLGDIPVVRLAPLGHYAEISHNAFEQVHVEGHIVNVDASNANDITDTQQFSYVSCDPEAYTGNLGATEVFRIVVNSPRTSIIILYSVTSDHCVATDLNNLPTIGGILTTTDTMMAKSLADLGLTADSQGSAAILPDLNSYTNTSRNNGGWSGNGSLGQSPTTAVAMIILYSITGIITALFVVIIISGAVRAHRHPERYGPRNIIGRGRQSRAKGIARAMLETLPIVKFGDHEDLPKKSVDGSADIEMNATGENSKAADANAEGANKSVTGAGAIDAPSTSDAGSESAVPTVIPANNPDGTDAEGHLGCSICTEDFKKGEELRVLPCNHKFHPDCVDPWLLNVSGTCPLCRIDLRPATATAGEEDNGAAGSRRNSAATAHDGQLPPPLAEVVDTNPQSAQGGRRETVANLRHLASGTREERIAALRRLRQERLGSNSQRPSEAERHGLTSRFRDRFRIRTERRETTFDPQRRRSSANIPSTFFG